MPNTLKYGSASYFSGKSRFSTCEIAGAVALCAILDLRVNLFCFAGFPQILVEKSADGFKVTISIADAERIESSFELTAKEAFAAVKAFRDDKLGHDKVIFDRVQHALSHVVG
jgi:hypothetical protein